MRASTETERAANRVSRAKHESRATEEQHCECWVERSVEVENTGVWERSRVGMRGLGRVYIRMRLKQEASGASEDEGEWKGVSG